MDNTDTDEGRQQSALDSERPASSEFLTSALSLAKDAVRRSGNLLRQAGANAHTRVGSVQSTLGEDYRAILNQNPIITETLRQRPLLIENRELLSTAYNVSWRTSLLWTAASGGISLLERPLGRALGNAFHYGPGHAGRWTEINSYMDSVAGSGHRLKFGHSIEYLPQIVERFGLEGVPAFTAHLLQDFMTVDGLPIVGEAWNVKRTLQTTGGLSPKLTTGLVSLSFSELAFLVTAAVAVYKLWKNLERAKRLRRYLENAAEACSSGDFEASVAKAS